MTYNRQSLTRSPFALLPFALAAGLVALTAWLGWQIWTSEDLGDPVATSLAAFERHNRLTVFSAELSPVVASSDVRALGMLKSRQVAVIPARVDYSIDLSRLTREQLVWDADKQQLTVTLPALTISAPNLDEAREQYLREGVWITADAQTKLTRDNTMLATQQAAKQARNPVLVGLAQAAARAALEQNLALPLRAAGFDKVTVQVRFAGESALGSN
jgi:hypothetical protein